MIGRNGKKGLKMRGLSPNNFQRNNETYITVIVV
jgi:hypothetical protein